MVQILDDIYGHNDTFWVAMSECRFSRKNDNFLTFFILILHFQNFNNFCAKINCSYIHTWPLIHILLYMGFAQMEVKLQSKTILFSITFTMSSFSRIPRSQSEKCYITICSRFLPFLYYFISP